MTGILARASSVAGRDELRLRHTAMRAIIYREFLLLTRNRTNLLLAILPTTIYLLLFSTSLNGLVGQIRYHGVLVGYPEFTIPAIMLSSMLAASTTTGTSLFQEETGGMAVELWSYPLSRPAYISGKIIATTALVVIGTGRVTSRPPAKNFHNGNLFEAAIAWALAIDTPSSALAPSRPLFSVPSRSSNTRSSAAWSEASMPDSAS